MKAIIQLLVAFTGVATVAAGGYLCYIKQEGWHWLLIAGMIMLASTVNSFDDNSKRSN
jgi:hypothetical protein